MPHSTPTLSRNFRALSLPVSHLPETAYSYGGPVNPNSTPGDEGEYETRIITPFHNRLGGPASTALPLSKFQVKLRRPLEPEDSSALSLPEVQYDFTPSFEGDTAPISHVAQMDDFLKELVVLNQDDGHSKQMSSVASYLEDVHGIYHPWVQVSRWDEEEEEGSVQMCLTVQDPLTVEKGSVDADSPLSARGGGLYER